MYYVVSNINQYNIFIN